MRIAGWYARKRYPHFDRPLSFEQALAKVSDPQQVRTHSFLPFIGYIDKKRRFSSGEVSTKPRPIKYCSHVDGYIHSYYSMLLSRAYESFLNSSRFGDSVIGYRAGSGTNINMAAAVFKEITERGDCVAVTFDISEFFPSIDHAVLLKNMQQILRVSRLSDDWFKVYRSMTKFAWVDIDDLTCVLGIDKRNFSRPICSASDFRSKIRVRKDGRRVLQFNELGCGIPQGSPISSVMSNVYMIHFDEKLADFAAQIGAYYKRYSDDLIFICKPGDETLIQAAVRVGMSSLGTQIRLNESKTEVCRFWSIPDVGQSCNRPLTYLGFVYDGRRVLLRGRTLSSFYRRMSYATRHTAKHAARRKSSKIYKRKLLRQFSHLGTSNFYSYARDAASIMKDNAPKRQLRRHIKVLKRKLETFGK